MMSRSKRIVLLLNALWVSVVVLFGTHLFLQGQDLRARLVCEYEQGKSINREAWMNFLESLPLEKQNGIPFQNATKEYVRAQPVCSLVTIYGQLDVWLVIALFL